MRKEQFLRGFAYFVDLPADELAEIADHFLIRRYEKGELLFLEGDQCEGLYLLQRGRVRVFKTSPDGREQVLRVVEAGESFNEVPNFDGGGNPAGAEAMEESLVALLPRRQVLLLAEQHPRLAMAMLRVFARRLRHLSGLVEDLSFRHVTSRLAKVLLEHASEGGSVSAGGEAHLKRRLTQQEMASLIGTAREMVGRSLKSLEAQGAVRIDRHRIVITNAEKLRRLV